MSLFQSLKENLEHLRDQIQIRIFGENNSRLDKILNAYYNLREEKRNSVRTAGIVGVLVCLCLVMGMYFYGLFALQMRLNHATDTYLKIQEMKPNFLAIQAEYSKLTSQFEKANQPQMLVSTLGQVANNLNLKIDTLGPQSTTLVDLPRTSVLSNQFQKAKINFQITGISLRRLTEFLTAVYQLPNKFTLTKLEILQVFGNKLYFDVSLSMEAYVPKAQKG